MVLTVQGLFLVEAHAGQVVDFTAPCASAPSRLPEYPHFGLPRRGHSSLLETDPHPRIQPLKALVPRCRFSGKGLGEKNFHACEDSSLVGRGPPAVLSLCRCQPCAPLAAPAPARQTLKPALRCGRKTLDSFSERGPRTNCLESNGFGRE
jgi:hypothetical protein